MEFRTEEEDHYNEIVDFMRSPIRFIAEQRHCNKAKE